MDQNILYISPNHQTTVQQITNSINITFDMCHTPDTNSLTPNSNMSRNTCCLQDQMRLEDLLQILKIYGIVLVSYTFLWDTVLVD